MRFWAALTGPCPVSAMVSASPERLTATRRPRGIVLGRAVALPRNKRVPCVRGVGLASGSYDLCITHDGDLHWLELNPNGQWGWLEDETGLPIAAAFADLLEQGATP